MRVRREMATRDRLALARLPQHDEAAHESIFDRRVAVVVRFREPVLGCRLPRIAESEARPGIPFVHDPGARRELDRAPERRGGGGEALVARVRDAELELRHRVMGSRARHGLGDA